LFIYPINVYIPSEKIDINYIGQLVTRAGVARRLLEPERLRNTDEQYYWLYFYQVYITCMSTLPRNIFLSRVRKSTLLIADRVSWTHRNIITSGFKIKFHNRNCIRNC